MTEGRNVLFTHASLVRALIDAALQALAGEGRVYVADAPLQGCDFARLRRQNGLAELERDYAYAPVTFLDLRKQWAEIDDCQQLRARRTRSPRRSERIFGRGPRRAQPPYVLRRKCVLWGHRLQHG